MAVFVIIILESNVDSMNLLCQMKKIKTSDQDSSWMGFELCSTDASRHL